MPDTQPLEPTDARATETPADLTGRVLGDYQLLRRIGAGGMGQVYLARQLSLKRDVAVKLLRNDLTTNLTALKRFQAEAEAVAKLNHPNIVHIHQIGEADGLRYMVLEYVEGRNLREYLVRKGPPDLAIMLSIVRQVVLALQKAHDEGIVHRDIKPENILVTRKVEVKVTDFGLSRLDYAGEKAATNLTQSGVTLGTPLYMSPEQVQGRVADHRSDIYSLGITCYHLLAGEPPFKGVTAFDVALKHVQEQPRQLAELRPDLPTDLCVMVHKMMAKSPAERYQAARDILRDVVKVRDGIAVANPTQQAALSLSTMQTTGLASRSGVVATTNSGTVVMSGSMSGQIPASPSIRWGRWLLAGMACLVAVASGVLVFAKMHPPHDPTPPPTQVPPAATTSGLADIRSPEKIVPTRERELIAALEGRHSPEKMVRWSIELGLLYVKERRLDEAEARFRKLENEQFSAGVFPKKQDPDSIAARDASAAGRLGEAVVLAHRDTPQSARASNELVMRVIENPFPRIPMKLAGPDKGFPAVEMFRLRHPDLGQALSDALNRNAIILDKPKLEPAVLDLLRTPRVGK